MTTNLVNGKKYIGKDVMNNKYYLGSGLLLKKAFKKYGIHNFKKEILAYAENLEELDKLEVYYINLYNALDDNTFYNLSPGGTGGKLYKETHPRSKTVYQYDFNGNFIKKFKDSRVASEEVGVSFSKINKCSRGECRSSGGFLWKYAFVGNKTDSYQVYVKPGKKDKLNGKYNTNKYNPVLQIDLNNNVVKEWNNPREIVEFYKFNSGSNIRNALINSESTAYGFKWIYKKNYNK